MKILVVHNYYQEPGGEDVVFEQECALLRRHGHEVITHVRNNAEIKASPLVSRASLVAKTIWSNESRSQVLSLLRRERPDLVHVHNTFPLISPSVFGACAEARVPVVQTLHNYRLLCPQTNMCRNGAVCEQCLTASLWNSVRHGCYRQSRVETAPVASMLTFNRWRGTWTNLVARHIALTNFARTKLIQGGLPPQNIVVKPNFVDPDPSPRRTAGDYALFVGRLATEKGLGTVLAAWQHLGCAPPLWVAGDGPDRFEFEQLASKHSLPVRFLGHLDRREVLRTIKGSRVLLFPSLCYETFGMGMIEAYACGVPVIASRHGAMMELVNDGFTGLLFEPGNAEELSEKIRLALANPERLAWMGENARAEYTQKYTAEINYKRLMNIYAEAACNESRVPALAAA